MTTPAALTPLEVLVLLAERGLLLQIESLRQAASSVQIQSHTQQTELTLIFKTNESASLTKG